MAFVYRFTTIETRGRPRQNPFRVQVNKERKAKYDEKKKQEKLEHVAVLDFETDPFNNKRPDDKIQPFAACLYSDQFEPIVIWENDLEKFLAALMKALDSLDGSFTIYAHNGGKFDYMFLIKHVRGKISFKGRGIMSCKIGRHELRDSFHIIPEKLANYKKDQFDYEKLTRKNREQHKQAIIRYMVNDCVYLFDIVRSFLKEFGFKISIGQAAMAEIKKHYNVKKIGGNTDAMLREYFFGGRVECLRGKGHFKGEYYLFDVNSMYPAVMAYQQHPIGNGYTFRMRGGITEKTCFIELTCRNYGALVKRSENNETTAGISYGRFKTTIWEFRKAVELQLIEDIKIHTYVDCDEFSDFSKFILPKYDKRQIVKERLDDLEKMKISSGLEFDDLTKESIFLKLLMNNGYGKFAQNPRRYKEYEISDPGSPAPKGFEDALLPSFRCADYDIWEKPAPRFTYNNVGTAASITGAARAKLLHAIHNSTGAVYCDTDSLICQNLDDVEIHATKLGAWKPEKTFDEIIIAGKKLYAWKQHGRDGQKDVIKVKSKGSPAGALDWDKMLRILDDEIIEVVAKGPTLTKTGKQFYMTRKIRATTPILKHYPLQERKMKNAIRV